MTIGSKIVGNSTSPLYYERNWSGADDPGKHIKENSYHCDITVRKSSGNVTYCQGWGCENCTPTDMQLIAPNLVISQPKEVQDLYRKARFKAQTRIVDGVRGHSLDLGNYVPEGRQTARMLGDGVKRLKNVALSFARKDYALAVKAAFGGNPDGRALAAAQKLSAKSISGTHLAIVYGMMPLLSDLYESANAWSAIMDHPREWIVRRSGSSQEDLSHLTLGQYFDFQTKVKVRVEYKVIVREALSVPRSLGLYDPVGMIWEGTKLSYIADWFIPIGTYLDNLNILPNITADVYVAEKYTQKSALKQGSAKYPWGCSPVSPGYNLANYQSKTHYIRHQRGPSSFSSADVAGPSFKPIEKALSGAHLRNAAALIHQLLS